MATEPPVFTTGKTGSTPFFIVPAHAPVGQRATSASGPSRAATAYHNRNNASCTQPSAKLQERAPTTTSTVTAPAPASIITDAVGSVSYKAPAHKHAHHLHNIPPREKTAKTLIVDHMLWQHTRARFLQARSELGLSPALTLQRQQQKQQPLPQTPTSPTPPTSPLQARRGSGASAAGSLLDLDDEGEDADAAAEDRRYSPSESESSQLSEMTLRLGKEVEDDIRALKFGVRGIERIKAYLEHHAEDDWYAARVDLDTAHVQRATAEGMEKVNALMFLVLSGSMAIFLFFYFLHPCRNDPASFGKTRVVIFLRRLHRFSPPCSLKALPLPGSMSITSTSITGKTRIVPVSAMTFACALHCQDW